MADQEPEDQASEKSNPERLATARLTLTRPRAGDVDAVLALHHDPRAVAHNPSDALADMAEASALFTRWDEHWRRHGFGYWMVRRARDDGAPIGVCGIKRMDAGLSRAGLSRARLSRGLSRAGPSRVEPTGRAGDPGPEIAEVDGQLRRVVYLELTAQGGQPEGEVVEGVGVAAHEGAVVVEPVQLAVAVPEASSDLLDRQVQRDGDLVGGDQPVQLRRDVLGGPRPGQLARGLRDPVGCGASIRSTRKIRQSSRSTSKATRTTVVRPGPGGAARRGVGWWRRRGCDSRSEAARGSRSPPRPR